MMEVRRANIDTIGNRIAAVRDHFGGSRAVFGDRIEAHKNTIGNYERGDRVPDADFLEKLAALGVNTHWVVTGDGEMLLDDAAPIRELREPSAVYNANSGKLLDADLLEDVLTVLREYQDKHGIRWQSAHEARLVARIYKHMVEQRSPTEEDRERTLNLVRTIMEGMSVESEN